MWELSNLKQLYKRNQLKLKPTNYRNQTCICSHQHGQCGVGWDRRGTLLTILFNPAQRTCLRRGVTLWLISIAYDSASTDTSEKNGIYPKCRLFTTVNSATEIRRSMIISEFNYLHRLTYKSPQLFSLNMQLFHEHVLQHNLLLNYNMGFFSNTERLLCCHIIQVLSSKIKYI